MPVLVQRCINARVAAMPFNVAATRIAAILKGIAAILALLHHCGNIVVAGGIAAMLLCIAATSPYFPDVYYQKGTS